MVPIESRQSLAFVRLVKLLNLRRLLFCRRQGAVIGHGAEAIWLLGGQQHPPQAWVAGDLGAEVGAAAAGADMLFLGALSNRPLESRDVFS